MAEFVSSFITGFQSVIEQDLTKRFKNLKIINLYDGLVHYRFDGDSRELDKIIYFNNTFFVLKTMKGKGLSFPSLVGSVCSGKNYFLVNKGSFRVRFQNENQFAKVDKNLTRRAEDYVLQNSKLKLDRLSPTNEVWFSIRREGFAFCGELISKREFTEKNLNKGELRPEIAYLICCFADIQASDTILEPFCGYGSIPVQLAKKFRFEKLYVSDLDSERATQTAARKQLSAPNIECCAADATVLSHIADKSINLVITDPPWGYFEELPDIEGFYKKMFASFDRVLTQDGRMVILSARKEELERTAAAAGFKIQNSLHTLVNGKKAGVYQLTR
ncbi:23S rRNA G2445 N2-methylase RlmL [Treponema bryantii]|uniref:23S rRNA G2445 N2-methylase RlmL n=1 Tax=Treponema bryantii TaxID=163 RepID=A0A1I3JGF5_9SPIR|nr:methyltransferase [Treponema bryantii]SFI59236.1 23S rRNA G2445 N2-methylase RlmL [Treponema bryantii]